MSELISLAVRLIEAVFTRLISTLHLEAVAALIVVCWFFNGIMRSICKWKFPEPPENPSTTQIILKLVVNDSTRKYLIFIAPWAISQILFTSVALSMPNRSIEMLADSIWRAMAHTAAAIAVYEGIQHVAVPFMKAIGVRAGGIVGKFMDKGGTS